MIIHTSTEQVKKVPYEYHFILQIIKAESQLKKQNYRKVYLPSQ